MAIPTFTAVGTIAETATAGGTGPISPGLPAAFAAGDIHVCVMETSNEPVTLISGWSLAGSGFVAQAGGLVTGLTVWWRRAVGGDTAPSITGPGTSASHLIAQIFGVRGCVTAGDPWDQTAYTTENVADTSVATPAITTATAETLVVFGVATGQDTATPQLSPATWTNASLATPTSRLNAWSTSGDGGGFAVGTGGKSTAGAVSSSTGTLLTANFKALFAGALKPAAGLRPYRAPRRSPIPVRRSLGW